MRQSMLTKVACIIPFVLSGTLYAQEEQSSGVRAVSPDELTSILLGEKPMPEGARILKLERPDGAASDSSEAPVEGSIGIGNGSDAFRQSMEEIQLTGEAAYAQAAAMVFRKIAADVEDLGRENMTRLLAGGQDIDPEAARGFLTFVDETNTQASQQRRSLRLDNCVTLTGDIPRIGAGAAVDAYVERQREIGGQMSLFYANTVESVDQVLGPALTDYLNEQIESFSQNTVTYRFDHNRYFDITGESPEAYYLGQCAQLSQSL